MTENDCQVVGRVSSISLCSKQGCVSLCIGQLSVYSSWGSILGCMWLLSRNGMEGI